MYLGQPCSQSTLTIFLREFNQMGYYLPMTQRSPIRSYQDALTVQSDLNSLEDWSRIWLLNKCHVLTLGKLNNIRYIRYTHRYTIYQNELEHVFEERDLGGNNRHGAEF